MNTLFELIANLYKKLNFYKTLSAGRLTVLSKREAQLKDALDMIDMVTNLYLERGVTIKEQSIRIDSALTEKEIYRNRVNLLNNLLVGTHNQLTEIITNNESDMLNK